LGSRHDKFAPATPRLSTGRRADRAMYTLDNLLADVARQKGALSKRGGGDYQSAWDAFNRYISAVIEKKQTLSMANFCKIGWRIEDNAHGKVKLRPHFQVAESFAKAYNLDTKAHPPASDRALTAVEEFNFSKAAIRFTQNLTKDGIFMGMRAILHQLGEVMSSGQTVAIDFEVGRLNCVERAVNFAFMSELYLREGLEVPSGCPEDATYRPSATFMPPSQDAMTLSLAGKPGATSTLKAHSAFLGGGWSDDSDAPLLPASAVALASPRLTARTLTPFAAAASAVPEGLPSEAASVYAESHASQPTRLETVQNEALNRHISQIEEEAANAIAEKENWEIHLKRCLDEEQRDQGYKRALAKDYAEQLKGQIQQAEQRRLEGRQHVVDMASMHDFPSFKESPDLAVYEYIRERRNNLKDDLDQQVDIKRKMKMAAQHNERTMEATHIDASKKELAMIKLEAAAKKEQEKANLHQAWDKDKRLHSVRRAIEEHHRTPASKSKLTGAAGPGAGSAPHGR